MVVGELAQIRIGDDLPWRNGNTVVLQRTVVRQIGDLHGVRALRIIGVADRQVAARTADHRQQPADQRHAVFALDQHYVAASAGRIVIWRDVDGHLLIGEQAAGAVVNGDQEGVGCGGQHLAAVVLVHQLVDVADREGGADGQLVAVQLQHALRRQAGDLDDDLIAGVVQVDQTEVDLVDRATHSAVAGTGREGHAATFLHRQAPGARRGGRQGWGVVFRGDGEVAGEGGRTAGGDVDYAQREPVAVAGFGDAAVAIGEAGQPRLYRSGISGEAGLTQGALGHARRHREHVAARTGNINAFADLAAGVFANAGRCVRRGDVLEGGGYQQSGEADPGEGSRLDPPRLTLQHPIATLFRATGGIGRGRDVRAGKASKFGYQGLPCFALGDVATVEQDVSVGSEVLRPALQGLALSGKGVVADGITAQA